MLAVELLDSTSDRDAPHDIPLLVKIGAPDSSKLAGHLFWAQCNLLLTWGCGLPCLLLRGSWCTDTGGVRKGRLTDTHGTTGQAVLSFVANTSKQASPSGEGVETTKVVACRWRPLSCISS